MDDAYYIRNLDRFVKSLPFSSVRFLYFGHDRRKKEWFPMLNTTNRIWQDHNTGYKSPLYISPGVEGPEYCYIYRESDVLYDVQIHELGHVEGFQPIPSYSKVLVGGAATKAHWGDHITLGLERFNERFYLRTHKTIYDYEKTKAQYVKNQVTCDVIFSHQIHEKTKCYERGIQKPQTLDWYKKGAQDAYAVPIIRSVLQKIITPPAGGSGFVSYHGRQYKKHTGPKGGVYILVQGRKVYLQQGSGNMMYQEDGFSAAFVRFMAEHWIQKISEQIPNLYEVIYSDDEGSDQVMVRYDFGNELLRSTVFAISKTYVLDVFHIYQKPPDLRTIEEAQKLVDFHVAVQAVTV